MLCYGGKYLNTYEHSWKWVHPEVMFRLSKYVRNESYDLVQFVTRDEYIRDFNVSSRYGHPDLNVDIWDYEITKKDLYFLTTVLL